MAVEQSLEQKLKELLELNKSVVDTFQRLPAEVLQNEDVVERIMATQKQIEYLTDEYQRVLRPEVIEPQYIADEDKDLIPQNVEKIKEMALQVDREYELDLSSSGKINDPPKNWVPADSPGYYSKVKNWDGCISNLLNEFMKKAVLEAKKFHADFVSCKQIHTKLNYLGNESGDDKGIFTAKGRIILYKSPPQQQDSG